MKYVQNLYEIGKHPIVKKHGPLWTFFFFTNYSLQNGCEQYFSQIIISLELDESKNVGTHHSFA